MVSSLRKQAEEERLTKEAETELTNQRWGWIFVALILAFASASIVIIVLALESSGSCLPDTIDVVIYQSNNAARMSRYIAQVKAVHKYMTWVNRVFILSANMSTMEDTVLNASVIHFPGASASEAFEFMPDIPGISAHAIFLSDMTMPFRDVSKTFMFYQDRPRIFNIFREQSEVNFFANYLELPTMPVLATDLHKLKEPPQTWTDLVFRMVTEERIVNREDMNRDIYVVSTMANNVQLQFDKLLSSPPLFATFHINATNDPNPILSNNLLAVFLEQQFK